MALVHPVFDCLMRLTHPDALLNEEEVRIDTVQTKRVFAADKDMALISSTSFFRWTVWCCSCIASESSWRTQADHEWTRYSSCFGMPSCCRKASAPCPACCCWRSWSSELEAGRSAPPQTSTTTVKLPSRIVARGVIVTGILASIQIPLSNRH